MRLPGAEGKLRCCKILRRDDARHPCGRTGYGRDAGRRRPLDASAVVRRVWHTRRQAHGGRREAMAMQRLEQRAGWAAAVRLLEGLDGSERRRTQSSLVHLRGCQAGRGKVGAPALIKGGCSPAQQLAFLTSIFRSASNQHAPAPDPAHYSHPTTFTLPRPIPRPRPGLPAAPNPTTYLSPRIPQLLQPASAHRPPAPSPHLAVTICARHRQPTSCCRVSAHGAPLHHPVRCRHNKRVGTSDPTL